jgi:hypothetical protein
MKSTAFSIIQAKLSFYVWLKRLDSPKKRINYENRKRTGRLSCEANPAWATQIIWRLNAETADIRAGVGRQSSIAPASSRVHASLMWESAYIARFAERRVYPPKISPLT